MNTIEENRRDALKKILGGIALAGTSGALGYRSWKRRDVEPEILEFVSVEVDQGILEVPHYDFDKDTYRCSKGARWMIKRLFGKDYARCDAWERVQRDNIVAEVNDFEDLDKLASEGTLINCPMIGLKNLRIEDRRQPPSGYTHNGVYLGHNKDLGNLYAHFIERNLFIDTSKELALRNFAPRYVFRPKNEN